ncbi:2Fe-2S iron-sulfur cluster-binding protein [Cohnella zeiphila]|uniref:2Fe-2S iron-sulfur cluster binding domain-containing protein n=1 Tax=Cohnella zeiphila TaxID=2761120 RepID=A0A7X0STC2_9BACL|nr:2Fe-2S iron-sulfur cluster-binding protein [Cohnella zeiphila]MBB6735769.1 2Fe-2S iron-sulfur cluster binding domain-containing protein [Cohnella zeiphila]
MSAKGTCRVTFLPGGQQADARIGATLLDTAQRAKAPVRTRCGGVAGCLMCKVSVAPEHRAALTEPTDAERRKLGPLLDEGMRLSCQARIRGPLSVTVPEDPLKAAVRRLLEQQQNEDGWL